MKRLCFWTHVKPARCKKQGYVRLLIRQWRHLSLGSRAKRITEKPVELAGIAGYSYTPPFKLHSHRHEHVQTHRYRMPLVAKHTLLRGVCRPAIYILLAGGIPLRGGGEPRGEQSRGDQRCGKLADVMIQQGSRLRQHQREGSPLFILPQ